VKVAPRATRARRPSGAARLLAAAAVVLVAAGAGCRREPPVASLLARTGNVERQSATGEAWADATVGVGFTIGDVIRTGAASSARLGVNGGGVIRIGENGRLRFRPGTAPGAPEPDFGLELGVAEIDSETVALSLSTPTGRANVHRGTRARVLADGNATSLEVLVGRAVLVEQGREVAVDAGHGIRIALGTATVERFEIKVGRAVVDDGAPVAAASGPDPGAAPDAGAERAAATPDAVAPAPAEKSADVARPLRGDDVRADVTITAGETATLHDGRPPLAIRVRFGELCPGPATIEIESSRGERVTGASAAVVRLRPGSHAYRVRCAGDSRKQAARASGVLSIRRDTGYVPLPRRAPANVIDADGRRYTVLFQSRLPQLTLAWPTAPAEARDVELHLESPSGARVLPVASLGRPLPAGTLPEGTYTWWYTAAGAKPSPKTTVNIRFDNAAPTAQFFRGASGASHGGARGVIAVDGVTVDGAKVSVAGQPLALDAHGRFRGEVAPAEGDDAIAVRLDHPRTGVHYYVRRRAEAR